MAQDLDKELGFEPLNDDEIGFEPEQQVSPSENSLMDMAKGGVNAALTALDYTYAPVRQAMTSPAKLAQGDVKGAILDPITQLLKSPSEAPTTSEVLETYGVPKEKKVSPIIQSQPLMGSTYEENPAINDPSNITINPSQQAAPLVDSFAGGLGIDAGAKALAGAGKAVSKLSVMENLLDAYKAGKSGKTLSGKDALKNAQEGLENLVMDARQSTSKYGADKGTAKRALLEQAEKAGKSVDVKNTLQEFADEIGSSKSLSTEDTQRLTNIATQYFKEGSNKSPLELEKMLREVVEMNPDFQGQGYRIVKNLKSKLRKLQDESIPEIAPLNKDITENLSLSEALLGESNLNRLDTGKQVEAFKDKGANKFKKYTTDIEGTQKNIEDILNKGVENDFGGQTRSLKDLNPEFANNFEQKLKDQSRNFDLTKMANDRIKFTKPLQTIDTAAVKAGEASGKVVKSTLDNSKEFLQTGVKAISDASPDQLKQISQKMYSMADKSAQAYGKIVQELVDKSPQSRNAIIFGLMQQPEFRKIFQKVNENE